MIWMTEKTIQKAVFPLPKTCGEAPMWGEGLLRVAVPMPFFAFFVCILTRQAVWLGCSYRGTQDGPLGKRQNLSSSGGQDECTPTCVCMCLSHGVCRVDKALTTPRTEKKMTMAKQAYAL